MTPCRPGELWLLSSLSCLATYICLLSGCPFKKCDKPFLAFGNLVAVLLYSCFDCQPNSVTSQEPRSQSLMNILSGYRLFSVQISVLYHYLNIMRADFPANPPVFAALSVICIICTNRPSGYYYFQYSECYGRSVPHHASHF